MGHYNSMSYWLTGTGPGYPFWLGSNPQPLPYGSFSSTQDQTVTGANTTTVLTYNTTDYASQTYYSGGKIYVQATGTYRILFTIQCDTTSGGQQSVTIWFRHNGVNIANSASRFTIQNNGENIPVCEIFHQMLAGDYVEVVFQSADANMRADYTAAGGVAPNDYPATPSIITVIQKIAKVLECLLTVVVTCIRIGLELLP